MVAKNEIQINTNNYNKLKSSCIIWNREEQTTQIFCYFNSLDNVDITLEEIEELDKSLLSNKLFNDLKELDKDNRLDLFIEDFLEFYYTEYKSLSYEDIKKHCINYLTENYLIKVGVA